MAIDTNKSVAIFDGSVATADIADDAVTAAKIDDDGTGFTLGDLTVSGNTSVASSSGNVSIGTTIKPPVGLTVHVGDADNKGVNLTRLETSGNPSDNEELGSYAWNSNAEVTNHLGSAEAKIVARASQNHSGTLAGTDMEFYVKPNGTGPGSGPTEKMKIHNGGVISIPDGIVLGNGLNATTANTLNDYEEGTFTPIWRVTGGANGFGYTTQLGRYTKIGNRVFGLCRVTSTSHSGSGGGVSVQGFPFTATNVTVAYHHFSFGHFVGFSYTGFPYGYINSNTIYADLQVNNNGSLSTPAYPSTGTIDIIFSFAYETDA